LATTGRESTDPEQDGRSGVDVPGIPRTPLPCRRRPDQGGLY